VDVGNLLHPYAFLLAACERDVSGDPEGALRHAITTCRALVDALSDVEAEEVASDRTTLVECALRCVIDYCEGEDAEGLVAARSLLEPILSMRERMNDKLAA
jgi:hypothetical protein